VAPDSVAILTEAARVDFGVGVRARRKKRERCAVRPSHVERLIPVESSPPYPRTEEGGKRGGGEELGLFVGAF